MTDERREGWRLIDTVPTQGPPQQVVVLYEGDDPELVHVPFFTHNGRLSTFSVESSNIRDARGYTHWMPLPSTPEPPVEA